MNIQLKLKQYADLMRLDKPTGTLLLLWPTLWGLWLAGCGHPDWMIVLVFIVGTFLMRSSGCVINDLYDSDIDYRVVRTKNRPITTGKVSKKEALNLGLLLCFFALLCLIPLNSLTRKMSLIAFLLAMTYPLLKRFFAIPQLYLGLAFSFGILMSYTALQNEIPLIAWLLYIANILWTLAYDTVYAIADKPDDLKLNIYSSAMTFGRYDVLAVMVSYLGFVLLMIVVGYQTMMTFPFWLALIIVFIFQMLQCVKIKSRDREICYRAFLENKWFGLIIFLGIICHYYWSWFIYF